MSGNCKCAEHAGFTIVEMIVAIVLVGIIAAVTISRFMDGDAFNGIIVRDQIISLARSSLQSSLGRRDVSLTITPNGAADQVTLVASESGGPISSYTLDLNDVALSGDINQTDSCGGTPGAASITNSTPMTINFGELGRLESSGVSGSAGTVTSALRICINNSSVTSICVSPSGFAYVGDCDVQ